MHALHGESIRARSGGGPSSAHRPENAKYGTGYGIEMVDPASNSVFALDPDWVFALDSSDFTGSPTRFIFRRPEPG